MWNVQELVHDILNESSDEGGLRNEQLCDVIDSNLVIKQREEE